LPAPLLIGIYCPSEPLSSALTLLLPRENYRVKPCQDAAEFFQLVIQEQQRLDCLILLEDAELPLLGQRLRSQQILLPALIVVNPDTEVQVPGDRADPSPEQRPPDYHHYHPAEMWVSVSQLDQISRLIQQVIEYFLKSQTPEFLQDFDRGGDSPEVPPPQSFHLPQQRLTEKLKERLGYLGVYYKRDPGNFLRHLSGEQKRELLDQLKTEYRQIVLQYFVQDPSLNQAIDQFVNLAFFADIPVSLIVELHMELMDEFAKQLKLEGRSEEVLLDYRLTLIDVMAHLCEIYRRSIPRES
jgi:circadian clock protein KaiA